MRFDYAAFSETGPRTANEDAVGIWQYEGGAVAVAIADGLGGLAGGAIASRMAVDIFGEKAHATRYNGLREIAEQIHYRILSEQGKAIATNSMATTLSAAVFSGDRMCAVHCGDSRIAVARGNGIRRLTTEHTEAQKLLDSGKLTREEFDVYPRRHILNSALGIRGEPTIETIEFELKQSDRVFFTTDGVHGLVWIRELLKLSQVSHQPQELAGRLKKEVILRGPIDNFSFVAVFVS